jgi:hypothetical protein
MSGNSIRRQSKEPFYAALRQTLGMEVVKGAAGSFLTIQNMGVKALCGSQPLPKKKKSLPTVEKPEM